MESAALSALRRDRPDLADLPVDQFAFPGPLRERLLAALLSGEKTAGSALLREYEVDGEALPSIGDRAVAVDSDGRPIAVTEVIEAIVLPMRDVDLRIAIEEGEGFASVAEWRAAHVAFWTSEELRGAIGDPAFTPDDDTPIVVTRFRVAERLGALSADSG